MRNSKKRKRVFGVLEVPVVLALVGLILFQFAGTACNEVVKIFYDEGYSPYDMVDSSKHLDYALQNSIYGAHVTNAAALWNGHKSGVVRLASSSAGVDVTVYDVNDSSLGWTGLAEPWVSPPVMKLNRGHLNNAGLNPNGIYTFKIVAHELGHCLGLAHNDCSTDNVMIQGRYPNETLTKHDKASYNAAYKHY